MTLSTNETILAAAEAIRRDLCYGGSGHEFYAALADWLENVYSWVTEGTGRSIAAANLADAWTDTRAHAFLVAELYLSRERVSRPGQTP